MRNRGSLRRLLALWLVLPLLALIIVAAIPGYFLARDAANEAFDNGLLDPAIAIANFVRQGEDDSAVDLPAAAIEALRIDATDRIFFQVTGPERERFIGNADIPLPETEIDTTGQQFYSTTVDGQTVRVAAISIPRRNGNVLVQVAETTLKRDRLVQRILLGALTPAMVVLLVAAVLFWLGVRRALAPLEQMRKEIVHRSPSELSPVSSDGVPLEVLPLVSALNELLRRLADAIESQKRFIANAAHQLRTPLAGLKTHVALMRRVPNSEDTPAILDMISAETDRASHLANQLLSLARVEPGGDPRARQSPVDLLAVAGEIANAWVPRAIARNIDLGFELSHAWVRGDPHQLREMFGNLIDNALIHTPAGGHVTVRILSEAEFNCVEIEDDGPGVPDADKERVFERFYRASGNTKEGAGLGLAIVREIAQRHEATVELRDSPGTSGLRVQIRFRPIAAPTNKGNAE
jgi:two-component system, OmpR family, sensor histidine kinase TctE